MAGVGSVGTVVWGTGNVGRAAIRAVDAHPLLHLAAVVVHDPGKVGRDAGDLGDVGRTVGVAATDDIDAVLADRPGAVVYAASGDTRPDDALADITRAVRAGAVVVTPSIYALYDPTNAPAAIREPVLAAIAGGGGSLFVSGIDPGWGNDILPILASGLASTVDRIRCQEIFDYATYDQPDSVRYLIGMGQPMDYDPPMVAATVPTMVWGGQIRLIARALGVELDEIRETLWRRPLDETIETPQMGTFEAGTQGALRFEVQVSDWRTTDAFDDRTRLAAEYAERYALDHHGLDEAFWTRMTAHYDQRQIVELSMCLGSWLAFGRLNHVLGLDAMCTLPTTDPLEASSTGRTPAGLDRTSARGWVKGARVQPLATVVRNAAASGAATAPPNPPSSTRTAKAMSPW